MNNPTNISKYRNTNMSVNGDWIKKKINLEVVYYSFIFLLQFT